MTQTTINGDYVQHNAGSARQVHVGAEEHHNNKVVFDSGTEVDNELAIGNIHRAELTGSVAFYDGEIHDPTGERRCAKVRMVAPTRVGPNNTDPPSTMADYTIILPSDIAGVTNKVLQVTGISGRILTTEWANYSSDPMNVRSLELKEDPGNGTNKITVQGPASLGSDYTLILPTGAPALNQFLSCSNAGTGQLVWTAPSGPPSMYYVHQEWVRQDTSYHWGSYNVGSYNYWSLRDYSVGTWGVTLKTKEYGSGFGTLPWLYTGNHGFTIYNPTAENIYCLVKCEGFIGAYDSGSSACGSFGTAITYHHGIGNLAGAGGTGWTTTSSNAWVSSPAIRYCSYTGGGYPSGLRPKTSSLTVLLSVNSNWSIRFVPSHYQIQHQGTSYFMPEWSRVKVVMMKTTQGSADQIWQYGIAYLNAEFQN